jgi:cold-inducible RNA-binding protein
MKIYVGNLSYDVTEDELRREFEAFGEVTSANIPVDKFSGRPRGFGFVEMTDKAQAEAAIAGLNGKSLRERTLTINEARPRTEGGQGGGSYGGRSGSGGGGRYGRDERPRR